MTSHAAASSSPHPVSCAPFPSRLDIQLMASHVLCGLLASEATINEVVSAGGITVLSAALKLGLKSSKKLTLSLYVLQWVDCINRQ